MDKQLTIVGVDPGTTLGYAVIDLEGNIIELNASKLLNLSKLISIVTEIGLPLIIATDKANVPGFILKLSANLGTRIWHPKKDLLISEKRAITRGCQYKSDHERDSLAAAFFAYKQIRSLLTKIDNYIIEHEKDSIAYELKKMLILRETAIPIKTAVAILEKPPRIQKMAKSKARNFEEEYNRLLKKHAQLKQDYAALKKRKAKETSVKTPTGDSKLHVDSKLRQSLNFKDRKITSQSTNILRLKNQLNKQKKDSSKFLHELSEIEKYQVVKIVPDLGSSFIKKIPRLKISKGDIIYIQNASIVSRRSVENLRKLCDVIIAKKPSKLLSDFIILNPKDLNMTKSHDFALVNKKRLKIKGQLILSKIVKDYRKSRS